MNPIIVLSMGMDYQNFEMKVKKEIDRGQIKLADKFGGCSRECQL